MNDLKNVVEIIPEETKKSIYKDGIKNTVVETGKTLSLLPRVINGALAKVEMWCMNKEFMVEELKRELELKLEKRNVNNLVEADPSIFIPSVQAISYSWEKNEIKNMYLNLMVSDMDKSSKDDVHPSFAEVIKQMDSRDAKIFTKIYSKKALAVCRLKQMNDNGYIDLIDYILPDDFYFDISLNQVVRCLNNLERLKLIKITFEESFTNEKLYSLIKDGTNIKMYYDEYGDKLNIVEGVIKFTEFGKTFYNVCCK